MKLDLVFQNPLWYIILCFLIGVAYAWLLYSSKSTFSPKLKKTLAIFRAVLVTFICLLLFNPLLKSVQNEVIKPLLVIGVDNSTSMLNAGKATSNKIENVINKLKNELVDSGFELAFRDFDGNEIGNQTVENSFFKSTKTDFGNFFKLLKEEFEGQNLSDVLLISDGIANTGFSPLNQNLPYQINAFGTGDTTLRKDIAISALTANKLAFMGNQFPVVVDINASLCQGQSTTVLLKLNNETIDKKTISFKTKDSFETLTFLANANTPGKKRYTIQVIPLNGEQTVKNNTADIIIDIVDGKEKILLLAQAPHPDIKALKQIINKNPLFELNVEILSDNSPRANKDFDILILHQLPGNNSAQNAAVSSVLSKLKPTLFIIGNQTNLVAFNGSQEVLGINSTSKTDKVTASPSKDFNRFNLATQDIELLNAFPPITAPFGDYKLGTGTQVVLEQKLGNTLTARPLLALNTNVNRKSAVFTAEGFWMWYLEEFNKKESNQLLDEVFLKTLQLISLKENKDKLRVYPIEDEFDVNESVILQNEAYNDLFERIYNVDVNLQVKSETGKVYNFSYKIVEDNPRFLLSKLPAGVYSYIAKGTILNKSTESTGQFAIREKNLENIRTRADFDFLKTLSQNHGGNFYALDNVDNWIDKQKKKQLPSKIISSDDLKELINLIWLLPLLIVLITVEWVARKYTGSY